MSEKETREQAEQIWLAAWDVAAGCRCDKHGAEPIAAALAEKDREIERLRNHNYTMSKEVALLQTTIALAEADRDHWKARAKDRDKAFRRVLELLNDLRAEKCPTYIRLPQKGCECETCNLFRTALEDEKEITP